MMVPGPKYRESAEGNQSLSVWLAGRLEHEAYQTMAERLAWDV